MDRAGAWIYFLRSSWVWGKRILSSRNFEYEYRNRWDFSLRIAWSYKEFLLFYLYSPLTPCPIQMSKILLNSDKRAANLNVKKKDYIDSIQWSGQQTEDMTVRYYYRNNVFFERHGVYPLFSIFLFTYLFSIKFHYYFISFSLILLVGVVFMQSYVYSHLHVSTLYIIYYYI